MKPKYKLIQPADLNGLHRIRALRDFGAVFKGEVGGYVKAERNLSQKGDCWVSGVAWVYELAHVSGSAYIAGTARVYGEARVGDSAYVYGAARVSGTAYIVGSARVSGAAWVYDSACLSTSSCLNGIYALLYIESRRAYTAQL